MPATPLLTVVDNANGSGATVKITGSDANSVNVVQVTLADRDGWADTTYTLTGDGTVQVVAEPGGVNVTHAWRVRVKSTLAGVATSDPKLVLPTLGLDAPHFYAIVGVQRGLIDAVQGIGGRVYRTEDPLTVLESHVESFPAVLIYPPAEPEKRTPADNRRTTWSYPINVGLADRKPDAHTRMELHLYQRRLMMDIFDRIKLEFPTTAKYRGRKVVATPGPVVSAAGKEGMQYEYFFSTINLGVEVDRLIGGGE